MVRFLLANRFPLLLWWGPHYIQFYNDAYRPILGAKHPARGLGQPVSECWDEIWHVLRPLIDTPFHGGPATWMDDIFLEINRHGFVEETHFTIAYSPVPDDDVPSGIGGVLATVQEITEKVIGERRIGMLRELSTRTVEAKTAEEACLNAAGVLAGHEKDIPFALLYLLDEDRKRARLAGAAGVGMGTAISPRAVDLDNANCPWPLAEALGSEAMQVVENLAERFPEVPPGPWSDRPKSAAVVPIPSNRPHQPDGVLVAGVSARLKWNESYRGFFEMATAPIATALANARAYEAEKRRAEALAELDRAKTAFFSNVSHEFRTPLTLLIGPVEDILAKGEKEILPQNRELFKVIHRNALRLQKLVNTLLDFSRIEAGRIQATYEPTDLRAFTEDLASVFRSAIERAGMRFIVDCAPVSAPVYVDRDMWEKVVLNLLSNAFKFTLKGEIEVSLREERGAIRLRVRDTGTGISEEQLPHIFERFHRIEGTQARTHEGTGIGLALVQELVKLHGGTVRVESAFGRGTTFTVQIPLGTDHLPAERIGSARSLAFTALGADHFVSEAMKWITAEGVRDTSTLLGEPAADPPAVDATGKVSQRPRILVADDNTDMRDYLMRLLRPQYDVEAVADGEAALKAARARRPDLVLTDVMMPKLDGFGLIRELRLDPGMASIPTLMLSARAGEEARVEGLQAGAYDYLIKPFSARELLARVSSQLELSLVRREASAAIAHRERLFRTLIHAFWHYRPDAEPIEQIDEGNAAWWREFTGQTEAERTADRGRGWLAAVHEADREAAWQNWQNILSLSGQTSAEYRVRRRDGAWRWLAVSSVPIRDESGVVSECVGTVTDISAEVHARESLKDADRRKDEFLAMLAHELRNPLAAISNAVQITRRSDSREHREWSQELIEAQVKNLTRMIDDLMDVSRITRGKIQLHKQPLNLTPIIKSAIEAARPLIEERKHRLTINLAAGALPVEGDPTRLEQVFVNLLNNAAKYTESGGCITLDARAEGREVVLRVVDTGLGMAPELLARAFDLFAQEDRTIARSEGGLGIGLTLVKSLVEMHRGTVTAESAGLGKGSRFTVHLPLAAEPAAEPTRPKTAAADLAKSSRVLVVDDNIDTARGMAQLLKLLGNDVRIAHDGPSAIAEARNHRPAFILLDIGLPGMDGYRVARTLRDEGFDETIFIAVSGYGEDTAQARSRESGFNHHLVKPVDFDTLVAIIGRAD
jgi:PAS domain S-box-containing protein